MRKRIAAAAGLFVLLFLLLCGFASAATLRSGVYVYDEAGLLSSESIDRLNSNLAAYREQIGADLLVFFTNDEAVNDTNIRTASEQLASAWIAAGGGYGENHEIISLMVSMSDRSYFINEHNDASDFLLDYNDIQSIEDNTVPYLSAGYYEDAVMSFASTAKKKTEPGFFSRFYSWILTGLVGGGAAMGIAKGSHNHNVGVGTGYYRSKNPEQKLVNDVFLNRTQSVRKINTERPQQQPQNLDIGPGSQGNQGGGGHF